MSLDYAPTYGTLTFTASGYAIPNPAVHPIGRFHDLWVSTLRGDDVETVDGTVVYTLKPGSRRVSLPVYIADDVDSSGAPTAVGEGLAVNVAEIEDVLVAASTVSPGYLNAELVRFTGDAGATGRVKVIGIEPGADPHVWSLELVLPDGPLVAGS